MRFKRVMQLLFVRCQKKSFYPKRLLGFENGGFIQKTWFLRALNLRSELFWEFCATLSGVWIFRIVDVKQILKIGFTESRNFSNKAARQKSRVIETGFETMHCFGKGVGKSAVESGIWTSNFREGFVGEK